MYLELRALTLGLVVSIALMHLLLTAVLVRMDREPGYRPLQLAGLTGFIGIVLILSQGLIWPILSFVLGTMLALASMLMFWSGLRQLIEGRPIPQPVWLVLLPMAVGAYVSGVSHPAVGVRVLIFNGLLLIPLLGMMVLLWRRAPLMTSPLVARAAAVVVAIMAGAALARIVVWLSLGLPRNSLLDPEWQHALPYLVLFLCLLTILLVERLVHRLHDQANQDGLTGLLNRLGMRSRLEPLLSTPVAMRRTCALLTLDLDHFKRINDEFGHEVGDRVLVGFADIIRSAAGPGDLAVRMGGEEFLLISFESDPAALAETIRQGMQSLAEELPRCTVSIGLVPDLLLSPESLREGMRQADRALYLAKSGGRDQVMSLGLGG